MRSFCDSIMQAWRYLEEKRSLTVYSKKRTMWRSAALSLIVGLLLIEVSQAEQQENFSDISIQLGNSRRQILAAQFECYLKIIHDPPRMEEGPYCNRTWDGWLCWADSFPGDVMQMCPNYFHDFDPAEKVIKVCNPDGQWFRHPESNRVWTNYTQCQSYATDKLKLAIGLYYLAMVGHGLSIVSLIICLVIFSYFKILSCQRVSLHKNMFLSFIINSIVTIMWLSLVVANNQAITTSNEGSCKFLAVVMLYTQTSTIFWMLCEGIYLHTLIIVAVFVGEQQLFWYYVLGWGFPIVPSITYAVARGLFFNDQCWISSRTHLLYIIHGPIYAALIVNFFFLLNIVRVLITKLKETHRAETNIYMKAVRATLILIPLLGAQFILLPWRPEECSNCTIYDFVSHVFSHFQGLAVAIIVCFCNAEAQAALHRKWVQWKSGCGKSSWVESPPTSSHFSSTSITENSCVAISLGPAAAASALSVHNFLSRVHQHGAPNTNRQEKSKIFSNGEADMLNKMETPVA